MHFMELKRFIIDDAVDFSHLFYLRGLRTREALTESVDASLKKWMEGTSVKLLAEVVEHVLRTGPSVSRVVEFYPGVGLTLEYLRLLLAERDRDMLNADLSYNAFGTESSRLKFEILHDENFIPARFLVADPRSLRDRTNDPAIFVYNHNQTVREDEELGLSFEDFLQLPAERSVVCMRVSNTNVDHVHTSVKSREISLPAKSRVIAECLATGKPWFFRYFDQFDKAFFLPDPEASTGLLIGYTRSIAEPMPGYNEAA